MFRKASVFLVLFSLIVNIALPVTVDVYKRQHVSNTGVITTFKIVSEAGIAAGVRRIEALTGDGVFKYYKEMEQKLAHIAALLKTTPAEAADKIVHLQAEVKELHGENESLKANLAQEAAGDVMNQVKEVKGTKLLAVSVADVDTVSYTHLRVLGTYDPGTQPSCYS